MRRSRLGHTRWATQGGRGLAQASPIAAGPPLCTHNGDLDPASITSHHVPKDELLPNITATDVGWTD